MPSIQFFWDNNQGAQPGWNRLQLTGGTTGSGVDIAAGSVVDPNGDVVAGVSFDLSGILASMGSSVTTTVFNSTAGPATTSGDAAWVSPASHFGDALQHSAVDLWYPERINVPNDTPAQTIELFGTSASAANNRYLQARVNGGTPQILNVSNAQGTNVMRFENVEPLADGGGEYYLIETARYVSGATGGGGNSYFYAGRMFDFVASPTIIFTTGDLQPGVAFNAVCTNFSAAPDDATFAVNTLVDGVVVNSLSVAVTVTDNLDGTYDIDGTMPALPTSGSASGLRFTDTGAGITHTASIDTV